MKLSKNLMGCAFGATVIATSLSLNAATTTGFGTIPGAAANAYSGSGIPQDTSTWTQIDGLPNSDTLTLSLASTQYKANPAPSNDGVNTFYVDTGTTPLGPGGTQRSQWNWDFYGRSEKDLLSQYSFLLTLENVLNGQTFSFDPLLIGDNVGGPSAFGNSESFDFFPFGTFTGYNPALDNTYNVTLEAFVGASKVGGTSIQIVAGSGAPSVPDGGSTAALFGMGALSIAAIRRKQKA